MAEPWNQDVPMEVAPVRAGEELPWDRLEAYLRPRLELPADVADDERAAVPQRLGQPHLPAELRRPPRSCCAARRSASSLPARTT